MRARTWPIALCAALGIDAAAEGLPTLSLRYMAIEAEWIVVGEPIDGGPGVLPTRYRVVEVLKGDAAKGLEIIVRTGRDYVLGPPRWGEANATPRPCIQRALLFLEPEQADREGRRPVLSGIRALSDKDALLVPEQQRNPGPMYLLPSKGGNWDAMLADVRSDLPRIEEIVKLGAIPDRAERNKAVLGWIEGHKDEFGGGYFRGKGWASLEPRLFEWVMESCIPADCWRALELSAEVKARPERGFPSFSSPGGRALLLAKAFDDKVPEPFRLDALGRVGDSCWPSPNQPYPGTEQVTADEQERIIAICLPLLDSKDAAWRRAAVSAVTGASFPNDAHRRDLASRTAVPRLSDLHRTEEDPSVRKCLVEGARWSAGESLWREITGNPHAVLVLLRFQGIEKDAAAFAMDLEAGRTKITEAPVLRLERVDRTGKVLETKSVAPQVTGPSGVFERGWEAAQGCLIDLSIPSSLLSPGTWWVTAEGVVGERREVWRSEPLKVVIP